MISHSLTLVRTENTFKFLSASKRGLRDTESIELSKLGTNP